MEDVNDNYFKKYTSFSNEIYFGFWNRLKQINKQIDLNKTKTTWKEI